VSRQDPGAADVATGQTPTALTYCTCRGPSCVGLSSLHKPHDVTGVRGACSNSNCDCKRFTEEKP
jgi:hypothetical protein